MLCTDFQSGRTAAIARHVSFSQITWFKMAPDALYLLDVRTFTVKLCSSLAKILTNLTTV